MKILIAEDENIVRHMVVRVLERAGYDVVEAENGDVALEKFNEDPDSINLALIDVVMPGRNGFILRQEMLMIRPELPVILTSGYSESVVEDLADGAKDFVFLRKPYNRTELLAMIRRMLEVS